MKFTFRRKKKSKQNSPLVIGGPGIGRRTTFPDKVNDRIYERLETEGYTYERLKSESERYDVRRVTLPSSVEQNLKFTDFINSLNVDHSNYLVRYSDIPIFETAMSVPMGEQLREYILSYGYLGYGYVEFFGINSKQMENSDMVKETKYLHKCFDKTKDLIAFENQGDGNYYLVDKEDNVYNYLSSRDKFTPMGIKLFDYIIKRISDCKDTTEPKPQLILDEYCNIN